MFERKISESNDLKRLLLLVGVLVTYPTAAPAQQVVNQVLEEVIVATDTTALLADFEDTPEFSALDVNPLSGDIRACQKSGRGLFCLVGNEVRRWPDLTGLTPIEAEGQLVLDCRHPDLNLDGRKANTCTAMTMNAAGTEGWLGGKEKGKAYSLINFVQKQSGVCPAADSDGAWTDFGAANGYCWRMLESGRPLLVKVVRLDATEELILLEERKTILSRVDGAAPVAIASSKSELGLAGNEQVLSIDVVAWNDAPYVLYTTTRDRVRAVNKTGSPGSFEVFDFTTLRTSESIQCDFNEQQYDITAGTDAGFVYATDRNFCLVTAMGQEADASNPFKLTATKTLVTDSSQPPSYVTSGPGISINLADCAGGVGCDLIKNAASLTNVQLVTDSPTGMTLYQIVGIPDCRYIPDAEGCSPSLVIDPDNTGNPAAQLLNVTPLIPDEVKNAVENPLPPLLISRQYRGQYQNGFYFDALFGVTEAGVQFQGVFNGKFDVLELTGGPGIGTELGCFLGLPQESPLLLDWDIVTTVSENFVSGTGPNEHRDTLINTGCDSSRTSDTRWSMKPFNLEVTPCTYNPVSGDVWTHDGLCATGVQGTADDAVFAKLLLSLYDDLGAALNEVACVDIDNDPGGAAPLSLSTCATLNATFANAKDKLDRCWNATQQPKESSGSQNCQSFVSQLTNFSNTLAAAPQNPNDVANRKSELQVRVEVLFHLYFERFEPSIPSNGFCEPGNPLHMNEQDQDCTAP